MFYSPLLERLFKNVIEPPRDPKSILQEWVQAHGKSHPEYVIINSSGPAHAPLFVVEVRVDGLEPIQVRAHQKDLLKRKQLQHMLNKIFAHD